MKKYCLRWWVLAGALPWLVSWPETTAAIQPRFYLSTERVYSPGEKDIHVNLEARGVPYVDFRLYRMPDPEKFFLGQEDIHRVVLPNAPQRVSGVDVLREVGRASAKSVLELARGGLSDRARTTGQNTYPDAIASVRAGAEEAPPPTSVVPLLKQYQLADSWREEIPAGSPEWAYLNVSLTPREPGVYLVEGVYGHEIGYTVVLLSRMVLLTRQSADNITVYAVDPDLGTPVPEVSVSLFRGQKELGRGITDEKGLWAKEIPLTRGLLVLASRGSDFALSDPSYHPANLFQRKVYVTTERPVYRPGQEVFFKAIIRGYEDEKYFIDSNIRQAQIHVQDPNGQEVFNQTLPVPRSGSLDGKFRLFNNAPIGGYRLLAKVDGKEYGSEFKVKAYRKPEYQVEVSTNQQAYVSGEEVKATVSAKYYFGPPVPRAKFKVSVYRTRFYVPWWVDADYAWYYSDAEYRNTMRETILEKEGRLDQQGKFDFRFKTLPESLDYTYGIEAVVTDAAENAISGRGSMRVTRAKFRIGIEPEYLIFSPGQELRVVVTTTDYSSKPLSAEVEVSVTARMGGDPAKSVTEEFLRRTLSTGSQGRVMLSFTPKRGGSYTIFATAKDNQGNQVESKALLYVTASGGDIPYAPEEMEIVADKRSYRVGDKARFLLLVPHPDAHLLVTVEGGRLYRAEVVRSHGFSTVVEVPVQEAQTPNFVIRAATVFDRTLYERQLDVVVPPREKLLNVAVQANQTEVQPGDRVTFEVTVTDHQGKPVDRAEVTLGVVDEAIYGVSPEITVPISRFFYHRKRNNVRGGCSLDFRFYGYGQDLKDRMAALNMRAPVVPGSFKALAGEEVRKEFKDTLAWFPRLTTDSRGKAKATVTVGENLTAWRGNARVVTLDTRVGQGLGKVLVSKPVVLRLAAPGYLVERDQSTLGVLVHNYTDKTLSFRVNLETEGKNLKLSGRPTTVKVSAGDMGIAFWQASVEKEGTAVLRAAAKAGNLGDAVELKIPVRPYGMEQVELVGGVLDDDRPKTAIELEVPESAAPETPRVEVTLSTGVAPALLASLEYLIGYPYGCTEQTMSRFLPDLVMAQALKDMGVESKELDEKLPTYIHAGLSHLAQLQHEDGGWGWWADDATDPFMTAYVVHGLAMAKRLGWKLNEQMLSRGLARLDNLVKRPEISPNQRSYLLYSLALAGTKYESMLEKLSDNPGDLSEYGKALLAMALFEMGRREAAVALAGQIDLSVQVGSQGAWWGDENGPGWERDPVETTAAVLRTLILVKPESGNISAAVRWLMAVREGDHWRSTRDTAMVVYALVDYLKKFGGVEYAASVAVSLNDEQRPGRSFGKDDVFKPSVWLLKGERARMGKNILKLSREGKGALYYHASVRYFGRQQQIPPRGQQFQVSRKMYVLKKVLEGDRWSFSTQPLLGPVRSGDEVLVVLDLEATQDADYIMVEDPIPAGVQPIESDRGYSVPGVSLQQPMMHREFYDQHAAFFIANLRRGNRTLAYLVRATLPGTYNVMPARILPMYDPQFAGNSANQQIQVVGEE